MNEHLLLIAGFFVFVLGSVCAAGYVLFNRRERAEPDTLDSGVRIGDEEPTANLKAIALGLFQNLGAMMPSSQASRELMQKRLSHAGYRRASAITGYFGVKCACALLTALVFAVIAVNTQGDGGMVFAAGVCGLGLGFLVPERILDARIRSRNERLRRALPSALDLVVMGLEAGQSLDSGLLLASRGLNNFSPELAAELNTVYLETRASKSRAEAIRNLAQRNSEPEIRRFCTLLLDSDRFGSSLAPTLRQHARFLRIRFRQKAQEAARKLTVKIVFPVFFLIFPSILVVTLGPAVITMSKYFKGAFE